MNAHGNDTTTTTRRAESDTVKAKALALATRYDGRGRFTVASGSTVGLVYTVQAPAGERNPEEWTCDCTWSDYRGSMCSHVRAAARELSRLDRVAARRRTVEA